MEQERRCHGQHRSPALVGAEREPERGRRRRPGTFFFFVHADGACSSAQLVELKNGETYNGELVSCDNWMNIRCAPPTPLASRAPARQTLPIPRARATNDRARSDRDGPVRDDSVYDHPPFALRQMSQTEPSAPASSSDDDDDGKVAMLRRHFPAAPRAELQRFADARPDGGAVEFRDGDGDAPWLSIVLRRLAFALALAPHATVAAGASVA